MIDIPSTIIDYINKISEIKSDIAVAITEKDKTIKLGEFNTYADAISGLKLGTAITRNYNCN
jgi:hypothetical protein